MGQQTAEQKRKRAKYMREYNARRRKEPRSRPVTKPKRNGRTPKGVELLDNFNFTKANTPSNAELKRIKDIFELPPPPITIFPEMALDAPPDTPTPDGFDKNAYQMLEDMRHAYRHGGGKNKLVSFAKEDDRNFVFLVKELMKIESALLSAKIRKENTTANPLNQQNFFVVVKGLEDVPGSAGLAKAASGSGIDFVQIQQAVDPTQVGRSDFDDVFRDDNDAPDMLFGAQTTNDDPWEGLDDG
jgi:hypothetical protein